MVTSARRQRGPVRKAFFLLRGPVRKAFFLLRGPVRKAFFSLPSARRRADFFLPCLIGCGTYVRRMYALFVLLWPTHNCPNATIAALKRRCMPYLHPTYVFPKPREQLQERVVGNKEERHQQDQRQHDDLGQHVVDERN